MTSSGRRSMLLASCRGSAPGQPFSLWASLTSRSRPFWMRSSAAMAQKLYVGNLPFSATEDELKSLFGQYGDVRSVNIISDRETGRPRGFAFVEMENAEEAIRNLDN